ncbi:MAG: hypothetical protein K2Q03_00100 [Sphingobacteriaceae bacterium]|nr:hypothetical protein [Sphingobacteriaceae bacterium]
MSIEIKITSAKEYERISIELFELQEQENLTPADLLRIDAMILATQKYEDEEL